MVRNFYCNAHNKLNEIQWKTSCIQIFHLSSLLGRANSIPLNIIPFMIKTRCAEYLFHVFFFDLSAVKLSWTNSGEFELLHEYQKPESYSQRKLLF